MRFVALLALFSSMIVVGCSGPAEETVSDKPVGNTTPDANGGKPGMPMSAAGGGGAPAAAPQASPPPR